MSSATDEYLSFQLPSIDIDPHPARLAQCGQFPDGEPLTLADDGRPCETASRSSFQLPSRPGSPGSTLEDAEKSLTRALKYYAMNAHRWPRQVQKRWLDLAQRRGYCHMFNNQPRSHKFYKAAKLTGNDAIPDDAIEVHSHDSVSYIPVRYFRADMCDTGAYVFARGLFGCPTRFQYYSKAVEIAGNLPVFTITAADNIKERSWSRLGSSGGDQTLHAGAVSEDGRQSIPAVNRKRQRTSTTRDPEPSCTDHSSTQAAHQPVIDLGRLAEQTATWGTSKRLLRHGLEEIAVNMMLRDREAFDQCVERVASFMAAFAKTHFDVDESVDLCRRQALDAVKEMDGASISDATWSSFWHDFHAQCLSYHNRETRKILDDILTVLQDVRRAQDETSGPISNGVPDANITNNPRHWLGKL
ncbi:hypothetical protein CC79DRAFT_1335087 [Sarocladium strictum]